MGRTASVRVPVGTPPRKTLVAPACVGPLDPVVLDEDRAPDDSCPRAGAAPADTARTTTRMNAALTKKSLSRRPLSTGQASGGWPVEGANVAIAHDRTTLGYYAGQGSAGQAVSWEDARAPGRGRRLHRGIRSA